MKRTILILLLTASFTLAQENSWEIIGDMPRPVAGGREWVDRKNIYILGGYSESLQVNVNWVQKYSTFLIVWKQGWHMQEPRFGLVADRFGEDVFFFGGVHALKENSSSMEKWGIGDSLGIINFDTNFKRIFSTGLIHNNKYYIIGGNPYLGTDGTLPYIIEYDLNNSVVSYESTDLFVDEDLPEQQMSAIIGDDIYIFGGVYNSISQKIYKFNTVDQSFERLPVDLLEPRAGGRSIRVSDSDQILIIGGYNETNPALRTVDVFSVNSGEYTISSGAELKVARSHFMAAYVDENIYVLGGYDQEGNVISEIELYDFVTDVKIDYPRIIKDFKLFQNYPNPFNPSTVIEYSIPVNSRQYTVGSRQSSVNSWQSAVDSNKENNLQSTNFTHRSGSEGGQTIIQSHNDGLISVTLKIYDILGNEIATLVNEKQPAGYYKIRFDGSRLPSGIYMYTLNVYPVAGGAGIFQQTKKMLLLK